MCLNSSQQFNTIGRGDMLGYPGIISRQKRSFILSDDFALLENKEFVCSIIAGIGELAIGAVRWTAHLFPYSRNLLSCHNLCHRLNIKLPETQTH